MTMPTININLESFNENLEHFATYIQILQN